MSHCTDWHNRVWKASVDANQSRHTRRRALDVNSCLIMLESSKTINMDAVGLRWGLHAHEVTDLDLHLAPVLVKLLLELSGLLEVALQLTTGNDEPKGNEDNDAAQHNGVDQPCQHCIEEPASIADGSLMANAGNENISAFFEQSQWISDTS